MMNIFTCMPSFHHPQGILNFINNHGHLINIIKEYGKIAKNKLLTECGVFINAAKANQWAAQNNPIWVECIKASLSKAAWQWVLAYHDNYGCNPQDHHGPSTI